MTLLIKIISMTFILTACVQEKIVIEKDIKERSFIEKVSIEKRIYLVTNQTTIQSHETSKGENLMFSITPSTLPVGLSFDSSTGSITGQASSAFPESTFTITAKNLIKEVTKKITLSAHNGFEVNALSVAQDASVGDGICETSTSGECSLTAAIMESAVSGSPKLILLQEGTFLTNIPLTISTSTADITLQGQGIGKTTITSNQSTTARFELTAGKVTINDITFNEYGRNGSSIDNLFYVRNSSIFNTNNVVFQNNITDNGAIVRASNDANVNLNNSFFYRNKTENKGIVFIEGDAIVNLESVVWYQNDGELGGCAEIQIHSNTTINNSICFENHTRHALKSAINAGSCGCPLDLDIKNTIVSHNTNSFVGATAGLRIGNGTNSRVGLIMSNMIISNNTDPNMDETNCHVSSGGDGTVTDNGHNIISSTDCSGGAFSGPNNLFSTDPMIISTSLDISSTLIPSVEISTSSPAIDSGNNTFCSALDHRGLPRPIDFNGMGAICDIGPIELQK